MPSTRGFATLGSSQGQHGRLYEGTELGLRFEKDTSSEFEIM